MGWHVAGHATFKLSPGRKRVVAQRVPRAGTGDRRSFSGARGGCEKRPSRHSIRTAAIPLVPPESLVFDIVTVAVMPLWAAMMFAPGSKAAKVASSDILFLLGSLLYVVLMVQYGAVELLVPFFSCQVGWGRARPACEPDAEWAGVLDRLAPPSTGGPIPGPLRLPGLRREGPAKPAARGKPRPLFHGGAHRDPFSRDLLGVLRQTPTTLVSVVYQTGLSGWSGWSGWSGTSHPVGTIHWDSSRSSLFRHSLILHCLSKSRSISVSVRLEMIGGRWSG